MKLVIAEKTLPTNLTTKLNKEQIKLIVLSDNTGNIVNSLNWSELYIAVEQNGIIISEKKEVKYKDRTEINNDTILKWINTLKSIYLPVTSSNNYYFNLANHSEDVKYIRNSDELKGFILY